jgi:hypothetical protein
MLDSKKKEKIAAAFAAHLAPVFEHFGISVTREGVRNPIWTLKKEGCDAIKVASDGANAPTGK